MLRVMDSLKGSFHTTMFYDISMLVYLTSLPPCGVCNGYYQQRKRSEGMLRVTTITV